MARPRTERGVLQEANALDLELGAKSGLSAAMLDRSSSTTNASPAWPRACGRSRPATVGRLLDDRTRPTACACRRSPPHWRRRDHLRVASERDRRRRDLCFKSGNARSCAAARRPALEPGHRRHHGGGRAQALGGSRTRHPARAGDRPRGHPRSAVAHQYVDLCMPRGGEGLIRAVADCSKVR